MSRARILAAGDEFVRTDLLTRALDAELERAGRSRHRVSVRTLDLGWPTKPWGKVGEVVEAAGNEDTMIAALDGVDAAVTHLAPFTRRVFEHAPDLRLVVVSRGGPVNVNLTAATRAGVVVCYAPGRNANAAAEFTLGLMLATCRNIAAGHAELASRTWPGHYFRYESAGFELRDATVGLVGYGAIGQLVARLLAAFGARVLAYDPMAPAEAFGAEVERVEELNDLLAASQVVSLHARQTEENRHLIGAAELARMPAGSVLVNTARGGLVDYDAMCDALDRGHLAAAGIDVFPAEPLPADSRLFTTPRLVMAPHIAGCSREVAERAAAICAGEVRRWLDGEPPAHCANPEVLSGSAGSGRSARSAGSARPNRR
ncbi:2-hydroxyacid dehydrogenase [Actinopolymorpha rutila]|uniref:D-3-phosphoglycerate dehydrogenase n=1 Tax=Actinopolymorpha rutila TaxID=446787 RepID=A0A852Z839_9ACTN|nr:2-hydroxyacid dehydrogenase [Actinopolymorpha rutila]NYH89114.1 D-3-phosphoglycerate dehydrogenase [Actinopolymorpha rutila]